MGGAKPPPSLRKTLPSPCRCPTGADARDRRGRGRGWGWGFEGEEHLIQVLTHAGSAQAEQDALGDVEDRRNEVRREMRRPHLAGVLNEVLEDGVSARLDDGAFDLPFDLLRVHRL